MSLSRYRYHRLSPEEKRRVVETIREVLEKRGVRLSIVFGSFVELESFRDIDVVVYAGRPEPDPSTLLELGAELEERLRVSVDLIPLECAPTKLEDHALTKGVVVLEKEAGLCEALLMQTLDELALLEGVEPSVEQHRGAVRES